MTKSTDYLGNFVYEDNILKYILTAEGKIAIDEVASPDYQYFLKDHLGNTRVVFNSDSVLQASNYYPFGMLMENFDIVRPLTGNENKYLYNGKELQSDFGLDWYDYGARFYDAVLGRWHVIDNKAEKYFGTTPYTYAINNPILFLDPDGNDVKIATTNNDNGSKTVTFTVTMGVKNSSSCKPDLVMRRATAIKEQIESSYSGYDSKTNTHYVTNVSFDKNETDYMLNFVNDVDSKNYWAVGTHKSGHNTTENEMQVLLEAKEGGTDANQTEAETSKTGAHEYGHTLSLEHGDTPDSVLPSATTPNLMNQSENTTSTDINTTQLTKAQQNVNTNMTNQAKEEQNRKSAIEQLNQAGGVY